MGQGVEKGDTGVNPSPSLDDLIKAIDHQIEKVPHPYAADGFEAFLGSQLGVFKKRGRQYIRFQLNNVEFALPLKNAMEIGHVPEITPLPNLPHWVLGICNVRGDILSVVDLKQVFDLKTNRAASAAYLIILHDKELTTAILVDKIVGMFFDGDQDEQLEKDETPQKPFSRFVQRIFVSGRRRIHLLNVKALMPAFKF